MDYRQKAPISREQMLLFGPTLDSAISEDHEIRLLDEILCGRNWTAWEAEYHGRRGQPPIHPRVMAAVILYGLRRRVRSSRVLEYLLGNNVDFMWLAEGREIDHSTICNLRRKFRQQLKDLFRQIARLALTMGVARLLEVASDGTRVKANNGRFETLTAEGLEARLKALGSISRYIAVGSARIAAGSRTVVRPKRRKAARFRQTSTPKFAGGSRPRWRRANPASNTRNDFTPPRRRSAFSNR